MKKITYRQLPTGQRGFTLAELMVTLAVVGLLAGFVAPSMRSFVLNSRLTGSANELIRSLQYARSEAIKQQKNVVVCMSTDSSTCSSTYTAVNSWITFVDINNNWQRDTATDTLIDAHPFESSKTIFSGNEGLRVSFAASGFTNPSNAGNTLVPTTAMVMCDSRGNKGSAAYSSARGIVIAPATGRSTVTRTITTISALSVTGGVDTLCPP